VTPAGTRFPWAETTSSSAWCAVLLLLSVLSRSNACGCACSWLEGWEPGHSQTMMSLLASPRASVLASCTVCLASLHFVPFVRPLCRHVHHSVRLSPPPPTTLTAAEQDAEAAATSTHSQIAASPFRVFVHDGEPAIDDGVSFASNPRLAALTCITVRGQGATHATVGRSARVKLELKNPRSRRPPSHSHASEDSMGGRDRGSGGGGAAAAAAAAAAGISFVGQLTPVGGKEGEGVMCTAQAVKECPGMFVLDYTPNQAGPSRLTIELCTRAWSSVSCGVSWVPSSLCVSGPSVGIPVVAKLSTQKCSCLV